MLHMGFTLTARPCPGIHIQPAADTLYYMLACDIITVLNNWQSVEPLQELPLRPIWEAAKRGKNTLHEYIVKRPLTKLQYSVHLTKDEALQAHATDQLQRMLWAVNYGFKKDKHQAAQDRLKEHYDPCIASSLPLARRQRPPGAAGEVRAKAERVAVTRARAPSQPPRPYPRCWAGESKGCYKSGCSNPDIRADSKDCRPPPPAWRKHVGAVPAVQPGSCIAVKTHLQSRSRRQV